MAAAVQWIWSEPHRDYYYVSTDNYGQPVYVFSRTSQPGYHQPPIAQASQQANLPISLDIHAERTRQNLDSSYQMRDARFFNVGRVFAMLYTEAAGAQANHTGRNDDTFSEVKFGQIAYSTIRRFIVVNVQHGFVYACAISTYSNRGTMKPGCNPNEHSVVFFSGTDPRQCYLPGERERGMTKDPIQIRPADDVDYMKVTSRVRFGRLYTIDMNVRVKDIGMVVDEDMSKLETYCREKLPWSST